MQLPVPTEHQEQSNVVRWLRMRGHLFFAVPNEARRSPQTARRLLQRGMVAGAPDLVLGTRPPLAPHHVVAVEMKRRRGGGLTPVQKALHGRLEREGWIIVVGYGANDAIAKLEALGY